MTRLFRSVDTHIATERMTRLYLQRRSFARTDYGIQPYRFNKMTGLPICTNQNAIEGPLRSPSLLFIHLKTDVV